MIHPADDDPDALARHCDIRFERRSGPGGQHRNKVESAVVLTHRPTGVVAEASERRSQHENRQVALFRLRVNLALSVRAVRLREQVPSPRWALRCRAGRVRVNPEHADFPALLAEVLDVFDACHYDSRSTAEWLQTTASQLVRFLRLEPRALGQVNRHRAVLGLRRLHP